MNDDELDGEALEARLVAVSAVRQIVQAVWALARAQLPRVQAAAAEATHYLEWVDNVIDRVAGPVQPSEEPGLTVVIGPERAFCGGLPHRILDNVPPGPLGLVGRRLTEVCALRPDIERRVRFRLPGVAHTGELADVSHRVASAILEHRDYPQTELWHPVRGGSDLAHVLLLSGRRGLAEDRPESYCPPEEILRAALQEGIRSHLLIGLVESLRSEVKARLALSESARTACDRRTETLQTSLRVARQEQITAELAELVSGQLAR